MPKKTWDDVRLAALHCPFLHQAVTVEAAGWATREEALIAAVLLLSADRTTLLKEKADRLMREQIQHEKDYRMKCPD